MKLAVVGVGAAGSRIANRIVDSERASGRGLCEGNVLLVNTREPSFDTTEHVPRERRVTIGDVHGAVDGVGTDGDPDLGAEIARQECDEIVRAFDLIEFHRVDGVLVVAGLAGGTGGGAGAVVIRQLKAICDEPVYAAGVLPRDAEGRRPALNAARSLQSFVAEADNVVAFDNDAWTADDPSETADATEEAGAASDEEFDSAEVNALFAERLLTLFAAAEFDGGSAAENQMDPSDVIRTLDTGGVSSIGYASTDLPRGGRVRSWLRTLRDRLPFVPDRGDGEEESTDAARINRLVRRAARSKLTLPCETASADRALILLSGPPQVLSRKGFESGRYWLEEEADVVEVRAGDEPHDGATTLSVTVLFSNVTDVPRIDAMQARALGGERSSESDGTDLSGAPASPESSDPSDPSDDSDSEDPGWDRFEAAEPR